MKLDIIEARRREVRATVGRIRNIEHALGVTREALERIKPELLGLAARVDLFPIMDFPLGPEHDGVIFRLCEDADHRFALFASVGRPGKARSIHNHTTWAVIAGVHGDEHNICYERVDDRSQPDAGRLQRTGELTVRPGVAIAMLPDDFHSIEVRGNTPSVHLHMYGMSHAFLPNRIGFAVPGGGAVRQYPLSYSIGLIGPQQLRQMLDDGQELALIDAREEGVFARDGHLLLASNVPLSVLEMRVPVLLPRKSARIVVCDGNDGLAQFAAARLMKAGYSNVMLLEGGTAAWVAAGFRLYTGVHVPSKAFGEYIQHRDAPSEVSATELADWIKQGKDMVIVDSRPLAEYRRNSIPGALDCPSAELPYRVPDLVPSPATTVVVNCGGRTRGIIGAQALINAGISNPVYALKDGTQGWRLAGFELDQGRDAQAPLPSAQGVAWGRDAAERVTRRFGISRIDHNALQALRADPLRTTYLLDVRSPEEFGRSHLPGAISAPGGQLVQTTDAFVGVRHAAVVVTDNDGVRATMTAAWLVQMGLKHVHVLENGLAGGPLESGPSPVVLLGGANAGITAIAPAELSRLLASGDAQVADVDTSLRYRDGHIPGAWHVVRSRLKESLPAIPAAKLLVFTSPDGILARFAATDASRLTATPVAVVQGGTAVWREAGFPLEAGIERMTGPNDDVRYRALEQRENVEGAIREYLQWEVDLLQAAESDPDFRFRRFPKMIAS
jgi:rhodanese-related sulfurtransferase/predicted metal-dependent enzyme (double-stranded beta helix superfamily)